MISSTPRLRLLFSFTVKSPRFASVTAAKPKLQTGSSRGVFDFGSGFQNLFDVQEDCLDSASELPGGV